jgi:hypothetical protein
MPALNEKIRLNSGQPLDDRYFAADGTPWASVSAANTGISSSRRYLGLTLRIGSVEYHYATGVGDSDLVLKTVEGGAGLPVLTGTTNPNTAGVVAAGIGQWFRQGSTTPYVWWRWDGTAWVEDAVGGGSGGPIKVTQAELNALMAANEIIVGQRYEVTDPDRAPVFISPALQAEAETGTENSKYMTALRVAQAIASRIAGLLGYFQFNKVKREQLPVATHTLAGVVRPDGVTTLIDEQGRLVALVPQWSPAGHIIFRTDPQGRIMGILNWNGQLPGWQNAPQSDDSVLTIGKLKAMLEEYELI